MCSVPVPHLTCLSHASDASRSGGGSEAHLLRGSFVVLPAGNLGRPRVRVFMPSRLLGPRLGGVAKVLPSALELGVAGVLGCRGNWPAVAEALQQVGVQGVGQPQTPLSGVACSGACQVARCVSAGHEGLPGQQSVRGVICSRLAQPASAQPPGASALGTTLMTPLIQYARGWLLSRHQTALQYGPA